MVSKPTGTSFDMPRVPRRSKSPSTVTSMRSVGMPIAAATGASDSLVGLGLVDGASEIDRACHRNIRLSAFRPQSDMRGIWVIAVLLFQRLLKRSKIHGTLVLLFLAVFADLGSSGQGVLKLLHLHASICAHWGSPCPNLSSNAKSREPEI